MKLDGKLVGFTKNGEHFVRYYMIPKNIVKLYDLKSGILDEWHAKLLLETLKHPWDNLLWVIE